MFFFLSLFPHNSRANQEEHAPLPTSTMATTTRRPEKSGRLVTSRDIHKIKVMMCVVTYLFVVDPRGTSDQQKPVKKTETMLAVTSDSDIARMQAELHVRQKQAFMPESEVTNLHVIVKDNYDKDAALKCLQGNHIAYYPTK